MEKELEVKLLGLDVDSFEKNLQTKGAKLLYIEYQENILLENISNKIPDKSYLRVRESKIGDKCSTYLTYKENIENKNLRENNEYTCKVDSKDNILKILDLLGIKALNSGKKKRIKYSYKNISIDIDNWDKEIYPHPYVEIEVKKEKDLKEFLTDFNISENLVSKKSISELQNELKK